MYCWVLKKPYSPLSSCLHVHSHSLSPVASHQLHLLWRFFRAGSCPCAVANCGTHGDGGMTSEWWFVCGFFLFPFQWWARPESVFLSSEQEIPEDCHKLPLVISGIWAREIKSVRRMSVCCCDPSDQKNSVGPVFQCHHGRRGEVSSNTLNED